MYLTAFLSSVLALLLCAYQLKKLATNSCGARITPVSVNYHLTRECNYKCGFCLSVTETLWKIVCLLTL